MGCLRRHLPTTSEQGLPAKIDNPLILDTVAEILAQGKKPDQA
jgi:hypothetical protein